MKKPVDTYSMRLKRVKVGSWFTQLEKVELERIAQVEGLSLSQTVRAFTVEGIRRKIHAQEDDLLYAKLRQVYREERQASDDRMMHFLLKTAFAAEQGRIVSANVLELVLKLLLKGPNADDEVARTREDIVSRSSDTATRNILSRYILPIQTMFTRWKRGGRTAANGKEHCP
jgi:hypothetical protein